MADEHVAGATAGNGADGAGPTVALQNVYVKDLSFEAPQGPFVPAQAQDPRMGLNMSTASNPARSPVASAPTRRSAGSGTPPGTAGTAFCSRASQGCSSASCSVENPR